jgi:hypothetical protein
VRRLNTHRQPEMQLYQSVRPRAPAAPEVLVGGLVGRDQEGVEAGQAPDKPEKYEADGAHGHGRGVGGCGAEGVGAGAKRED